MAALLSSCLVCRRQTLRSHILVGKFRHVQPAWSLPWTSSVTSSPTGGRSCGCFWLPASAQNMGKTASDCLEIVLACSGDPPDLIGTSSSRIWLTSYFGHFGPTRGRRLVCLLSSSVTSLIRGGRRCRLLFCDVNFQDGR